MSLAEYFDRVSLIHLPKRLDRYRAMRKELAMLGMDIEGPVVQIPAAPMPADADGFASRSVRGSFLSHYEILRDALRDGLETVLVLEDDAIFSRRMIRTQAALAATLRTVPWDLCYFGHTLRRTLAGEPKGLVRTSAPFYWAHCYAVHARVLQRLVTYLEQTQANPPGHPQGSRVYIDAAYTLFRQQNPDVITLVGNPVLSVQRGSPSNCALNGGRWYDRNKWLSSAISCVRGLRDECWRWTGLSFGGARPHEV